MTESTHRVSWVDKLQGVAENLPLGPMSLYVVLAVILTLILHGSQWISGNTEKYLFTLPLIWTAVWTPLMLAMIHILDRIARQFLSEFRPASGLAGEDYEQYEHRLTTMPSRPVIWLQYPDGYYSGLAGMHLSARDAAKFGLLYLNDGEYEGHRIFRAGWVRDSRQRYSEGFRSSYGYFRDLGYGYQWWSGRAGDRYFSYAAGHGGQYVVLLDELDMVIVTAADPFWQQHDDESWKHESAVIKLVGKFINSLPSE